MRPSAAFYVRPSGQTTFFDSVYLLRNPPIIKITNKKHFQNSRALNKTQAKAALNDISEF